MDSYQDALRDREPCQPGVSRWCLTGLVDMHAPAKPQITIILARRRAVALACWHLDLVRIMLCIHVALESLSEIVAGHRIETSCDTLPQDLARQRLDHRHCVPLLILPVTSRIFIPKPVLRTRESNGAKVSRTGFLIQLDRPS